MHVQLLTVSYHVLANIRLAMLAIMLECTSTDLSSGNILAVWFNVSSLSAAMLALDQGRNQVSIHFFMSKLFITMAVIYRKYLEEQIANQTDAFTHQ